MITDINNEDRLVQKTFAEHLEQLLAPMRDWTQTTVTQAEVRIFILDNLYQSLPRLPFTEDETEAAAASVYDYVWQRSAIGQGLGAARPDSAGV